MKVPTDYSQELNAYLDEVEEDLRRMQRRARQDRWVDAVMYFVTFATLIATILWVL